MIAQKEGTQWLGVMGQIMAKHFFYSWNLLPSNKDVLQIFIFQFSLEHQLEHTDEYRTYKKIYTVGTESIQTPLNVSLFVILQPFAKII